MTVAPATKSEYLQRYAAGEFGNRPVAWASVQELIDSGHRSPVSVRWRERNQRSLFGVPFAEAIHHTDAHFNEAMPDHLLAIQGELSRTEAGWELNYSTEPNVGHADAMNRRPAKHARGLAALMVLRQYLPPADYEDLLALFDTYDQSTSSRDVVAVEFSTFRCVVGNAPNRRTIHWEVRSY